MGDQRGERQYRRIGDTAKCPACGCRMDAEAYRCPKCYIYFCFKCRARVTEREPQFQCADQSCPCYGKLLCAACTIMVPEFGDVTSTEYDEVPDKPEHKALVGDNWGFAALIIPVVAGAAMSAWVKTSFYTEISTAVEWGIAAAILAFIIMGRILSDAHSTWFKREKLIPATTKRVPRKITENKQIAEHRCCIQCKHPIKAIR